MLLISKKGRCLLQAGYSHHGAEPVSVMRRFVFHSTKLQVYSGVSGNLLHLDIFTGVVYYQRLRHMIADKSQVRATGPVHKVTLQPVKGRKRHGGIRLGEMERDALIAHGIAFSLCDRLMDCSDRTMLYNCSNPECACSSLSVVGPHALPEVSRLLPANDYEVCQWCCDIGVNSVAVPYICRLAEFIESKHIRVIGTWRMS